MTEARGQEMLLKLYIGEALVGVAGLLVNSFVVGTEAIDVTNKAHSWQILLEGGKQKVDIDAEMIVLDDAVQELIESASTSGSTIQCAIDDVLGEGFNGHFLVGGYERTGPYDGAETATITLHSFGLITPGVVPPVEEVNSVELYGFNEWFIAENTSTFRPTLRGFPTYTVT